MIEESEYLSISSLAQIAHCERRWQLINMEGAWTDNIITAEGNTLHDKVHTPGAISTHGLRIIRGHHLVSLKYGLYGISDLIELHRDEEGVEISGYVGLFRICPVEYKRGLAKNIWPYKIQLCAQAVCLEERYGTNIPEAALYHIKTKKRTNVKIDQNLRCQLAILCDRARDLMAGRGMALPRFGKHCESCSLAEICMPDIIGTDMSSSYLKEVIRFASDT